MARKSAPTPATEAVPPRSRFLAIRADVLKQLDEWRADDHRKVVVQKWATLGTALLGNDAPMIAALLRLNCAEAIKGANNLLEVGPKQNRGGAPRLFILREGVGAIWLAVGLEKGTGGVPEIGDARSRTLQLRTLGAPGNPALLPPGEYEVFNDAAKLLTRVGLGPPGDAP